MTTETDAKSPFEFSISKDQKEKISDVLKEVSKLTNLEQWYLYLKLPSCPVIEERTKSPAMMSSPSGKRTSAALNWIQNHYIEDRRVCVPKQEVYDQYRNYCDSNDLNPVAIPDFGKIMKTAFPNIHDRRLGQRGKSKYCYGGLKKKVKDGESQDAESSKIEDASIEPDPVEELENLSCQLVCEWASRLLGKTFSSVKSLAQYLVYSGASCGKKAALFNMLYHSWGTSSLESDKKSPPSSLCLDTQALLQRKLAQKEVMKAHKNLLNRLEGKSQPDTMAMGHSTVTRLTVLSPSTTPTPFIHQPSTLHLLNLTPSVSIPPLLPNVLPGQDNKSLSLSVTAQDNNGSFHKLSNETQGVDKDLQSVSLSVPTTRPHSDKLTQKTKKSKLVSSKSYEDGNQRQPKRNRDTTNQTGDCKRRRCITSLGMQQGQPMEGTGESRESMKEASRSRPFSCPVFGDNVQTIDCDMESDDVEPYEMCPSAPHFKPPNPVSDKDNCTVLKDKVEADNVETATDTNNVSSSFHFVRKPKVISIKPPEQSTETKESVNTSVDNICDKSTTPSPTHESPVRKSHHILNSILSSSDSNLPHPCDSGGKKVLSVSQSLNQLSPSSLEGGKVVDMKDSDDKTCRKEAHTIDNAYLLPRQSSRSAFVPVCNGKANSEGRLDITPKLRHTSLDGSLSQIPCQQNDVGFVEARAISSDVLNASAVKDSGRHEKSSEGDVIETKGECVDNFKPIPMSLSSSDNTCSSNDTKPVSWIDSCNVTVAQCTTTTIPTSKLSTAESGSGHVTQTISMTSPVTCQSKPVVVKSPVTPPRRQSKSRFTPIRPKLSPCPNLSPQKNDMRPVGTILREQRARSAQELLVNLASPYQGGIKVQLPAELLSLSSPDKNNSSKKSDLTSQQQLGQEITVILDSISASGPVTPHQTSPLICSQTIVPSTSTVLTVSPKASLVPLVLSRPVSGASTPLSHHASITPTPPPPPPVSCVTTTPSQPVAPILLADAKGTMYSLASDTLSAKPFQKTSNLQQLLQGNNSSTAAVPSSQSVISLSDIQGQVVGPDASGQTYLLVPNSESTSTATTKLTLSPNLTVTSTLSKQTLPVTCRSTPGLRVSSSSALLSELSHMASASCQNKAKQPIQYNSATSAFQKCEPNKALIPTNSDHNLEPVNNNLNLETSFTKLKDVSRIPADVPIKQDDWYKSLPTANSLSVGVSTNEICDSSEDCGETVLRKRKASKSQDEKEKKRQNRKGGKEEGNNTGGALNPEQNPLNRGGEDPGAKTVLKGTVGDQAVHSGGRTDMSDTETLLDLISDSRSMTVKETVLAMNTLRARMQKSQASTSPSRQLQEKSLHCVLPSEAGTVELKSGNEVKPILVSSEKTRQSTNDPVRSEKSGKGTLHVVRRNTSLNLESLESDALLDTELSLDHYMQLSQGQGLDHKTSVAVAARSASASCLSDKLSVRKGNTSHHQQQQQAHHTISSKALQSYHRILNDKTAKSGQDRKNDKEVTLHNKAHSVEQLSKPKPLGPNRGKKTPTEEHHVSFIAPRRSVSCVKDILERGSKPLLASPSRPETKRGQEGFNFSDVDAFDVLLSEIQSKQLPSLSAVRSHSSCLDDSELPLDIVDFVTENTANRRDTLSITGNSCSNLVPEKQGNPFEKAKYQPSKIPYGIRCVSVPNTKPDFFDMGHGQTIMTSSSSESSTLSAYGSQSQLSSQASSLENILGRDESVPKSVFLSPVGPAKLARRSSVEKSVFQVPQDKSGTRTGMETNPSNSGSQFTSLKDRSGTDCNASSSHRIQYVERHRTKTPVDRSLLTSHDKHSSHPSMLVVQTEGNKYPQQDEMIPQMSPVNRSLTRTPIDKFFSKQTGDCLPLRFEPLPPHKSTVVSAPTPTSDGGYSGGSVSHTPSSDHGQMQTPSSDFGYSSVSPSPVMMSSSAGFPGGECGGRTLSPATIFMPLRSDSALSLTNNNVVQSESPAATTQTNLLDRLSGFLCDATQNDPDSFPLRMKSEHNESLFKYTSNLSDIPSLLESLDPKSLEGKESKSLLRLISSSLQSIPTPPVSPSSSPSAVTSSSSLPLSPLPRHLEVSSSPPDFLLPAPSSALCLSTSGHDSSHQFILSPPCRSQDLPSPAFVARSYTPSPQILNRPPSSPHQFYSSSHPSPPFTPSSLRSLPSPRCLTPSSHKSLVSPRSLTPSSDPNQAPNRFMPIQSSGVLPVSQAPRHTYIQPIKPVVALASMSTNSLPLLASKAIPSSTAKRSAPSNTHLVSSAPVTRPSPHSRLQESDTVNAIRTSEHKPLESNSTLVLSLSGDIGSFSCQGVGGMPWASSDSSSSVSAAVTTRKPSNSKQAKKAKRNRAAGEKPTQTSRNKTTTVLQTPNCEKSSNELSNTSHRVLSTHTNVIKRPEVFHKPSQDSPSVLTFLSPQVTGGGDDRNNPSALLKLLSGQPNSFQPNSINNNGSTTNVSMMRPFSTTAFRPPPDSTLSSSSSSSSSSASICSVKTVLLRSPALRQPDSKPQHTANQHSLRQPHQQLPSSGPTTGSLYHPPTHRLVQTLPPPPPSTITTTFAERQLSEVENLPCPTPSPGQDELQATLDVLKNMDSQYFQWDEEDIL